MRAGQGGVYRRVYREPLVPRLASHPVVSPTNLYSADLEVVLPDFLYILTLLFPFSAIVLREGIKYADECRVRLLTGPNATSAGGGGLAAAGSGFAYYFV